MLMVTSKKKEVPDPTEIKAFVAGVEIKKDELRFVKFRISQSHLWMHASLNAVFENGNSCLFRIEGKDIRYICLSKNDILLVVMEDELPNYINKSEFEKGSYVSEEM